MKEIPLTLEADDGKSIYGLLSEAIHPARNEDKRLVVLAHGLTGNPLEHQHMLCRDILIENGYDVIQFWFYHHEPDARKLHECTLASHVRDLRSVLKGASAGYDSVFVAGHSYGGLTTILCNPDNVKAISLWDPSFKPWKEFWHGCLVGDVPEYKAHLMDGHYYGMVGRAMVEEARSLTEEEVEAAARELEMPCQLVLADREMGRIENDLYNHLIMTEKERIEIAGADHGFRLNHSGHELADTVCEWFDKF